MEGDDSAVGTTGMPPGFVFAPTDDEIIRYYLSNRIHGHECPWLSMIPEFDLYGENGPWDLLQSDEAPVYVFAMSKNLSKERKQRTCAFGTWKFQKTDEIEQEGQVIGHKSLLTFIPDEAKIDPQQLGGSWHMNEYSLPDSKGQECIVLCRASFKKIKKRGRQAEMIPDKDPPASSKKARTTPPPSSQEDNNINTVQEGGGGGGGAIDDEGYNNPDLCLDVKEDMGWDLEEGCLCWDVDYSSFDNSTAVFADFDLGAANAIL